MQSFIDCDTADNESKKSQQTDAVNQLIIEDGYNTDYIVSLIIALFYPSNRIISIDSPNSNAYYIQTFIRANIIEKIRRGISIDSATLNRLRIFMNGAGWLRHDILEPADVVDFYDFLVVNIIGYRFSIQRIDTTTNQSNERSFNFVNLTEQHFDSLNERSIVSVSDGFTKWIDQSIIESKYAYRFDAALPWLVAVHVNIRDESTKLNRCYVDIMEGLCFDKISNRTHAMFVWDIQSFIGQTDTGEYYAVTMRANEWVRFSDRTIPSVTVVDMNDQDTVRRMMKEIRMAFYKLQSG